jgi:3-hydroxyacyl-[acyl-carrier-protein] dehydratase
MVGAKSLGTPRRALAALGAHGPEGGSMSPAAQRVFPITLDLPEIQAVLPHRGEILFVRRVVVLEPEHFVGEASWSSELHVLQGHFPGLPMVPGVLLIEAVAQVAGAGMLVGDERAAGLEADHVGVLAGVRKCSFKRPVAADTEVLIDVRTRQMSPLAASVAGVVSDAAGELASVEILILNTPREQLALGSDAPRPAHGADRA